MDDEGTSAPQDEDDSKGAKEEPIRSRLHGRFPTTPSPSPHSSRLATQRVVPLSPKGKKRDKEEEEYSSSFNFPPPTRSHAVEARSKGYTAMQLDGGCGGGQVGGGGKGGVMVGEWKLGESLGKGTSGTVYLARSVKNGNFSAIKKVGRLPQNHKVRKPSFLLS
ncbi:hypothetical protein JCM16303_006316 [Sporobolomyces ruberrimus]